MEEGIRRKYYIKPEIGSVGIDRNISLLLQTDGLPSGDGPYSVSSTESTSEEEKTTPTTEKTSFDENPFER
jgi:hypothetical protein